MRKNWIKFLVGGVVVNLAMLPLLAQAQQTVSDTQVTAIVEALRQAAPQPKKPTNSQSRQFYTEWQIKPETLRGWSKFCLKKELPPTEFENNRQRTQEVVSCIIRREFKKQYSVTNNENASVRNVACWWMTGQYTGCNSGFTGTYVEKVVGFYQKQRSKPAVSPSPSSTP